MKIDAIMRRLSDRQKTSFDPFAQMIEDSRLPGDVQPLLPTSSLDPPRSVLLTGATGFLGGYLLRTLLRETHARVCCLVRTGEAGILRLRRNLEAYGIWEDAFESRIDIVDGDLDRPLAGMPHSEYNALSNSIDAVFHCGAAVNWIYPYRRLAGVNVRGTLELLRFACTAKPKAFHFVSSSAVCHSTAGPGRVDETEDMLPYIHGIYLGYAQTKCVAESLVRQASERGLQAFIYRPTLISGDSRTGHSNHGDFLSMFIKGCIEIGSAPDLDWQLDCCPVDFVAQSIVGMSGCRSAPPAFHLVNPEGRHWRELILWINLFGYSVRLLSYRSWLLELKRSLHIPHHPLREIAPFFCYELPGESGLHLPYLYEEDRRSVLDTTHTRQALENLGESCAPPHPLNAQLLDRYFESFIRTGYLLPPHSWSTRAVPPVMQTDHDHCEYFSSILHCKVRQVTPARVSADHSVITELTSWRFKNRSGLFRYNLELSTGRNLDVMVKMKPLDSEVIEVGNSIASLCSEELGAAYARFGCGLEFAGSHLREPAIYAQQDARFRRYVPELYGLADRTLILEYLSDVTLKDSVDDVSGWTRPYIAAAIDGIAEFHALWFERGDELLRHELLGPTMHSSDLAELMPFWTALANHALPFFSSWAGSEMAAIQMQAIASIDDLKGLLAGLSTTLIHNDFNPRNIAFRHTASEPLLCAYDWEMARIGLPQHDLAELLCFVLDCNVTKSEVDLFLALHRSALRRASGVLIGREEWIAGFRLGLVDLLINRFAMYTMVHRFRQQRFLPRVIRTWRHLYEMF